MAELDKHLYFIMTSPLLQYLLSKIFITSPNDSSILPFYSWKYLWTAENQQCDEELDVEGGRHSQVWSKKIYQNKKSSKICRFKCNVDMKCMVSYIQWYHQEFDSNGEYTKSYFSECVFIYPTFSDTSRLLRTGASMGNPYLYVIKVRVMKADILS